MRSDLQENSRHVSSLMQKIVEDMYEGLSHTALACEKQDIFDAACSYHAWKWGVYVRAGLHRTKVRVRPAQKVRLSLVRGCCARFGV